MGSRNNSLIIILIVTIWVSGWKKFPPRIILLEITSCSPSRNSLGEGWGSPGRPHDLVSYQTFLWLSDSTVTLGQVRKNIYFSCFMGGGNPYLNINGFCGSHHISFMSVIDFCFIPRFNSRNKRWLGNTN